MNEKLPAPRSAVDWDAVERQCALSDAVDAVFDLLRHPTHTEESVMRFLRAFLVMGELEDILRCQKIARHEFEFPLPRGRVDLALFHVDGGVSIVEAKAKLSEREILAGVGQLLMYAVQIGAPKSVRYVRKFLIAPVQGAQSLLAWQACQEASIEFIPIGDSFQRNEIFQAVVGENV